MSPRRVAAPALLVLLCVVSASTVLAGCPSGSSLMSNTATTWKIADFCKLSSNCYDCSSWCPNYWYYNTYYGSPVYCGSGYAYMYQTNYIAKVKKSAFSSSEMPSTKVLASWYGQVKVTGIYSRTLEQMLEDADNEIIAEISYSLASGECQWCCKTVSFNGKIAGSLVTGVEGWTRGDDFEVWTMSNQYAYLNTLTVYWCYANRVCREGEYADSSGTCQFCPAGRYRTTTGGTGVDSCSKCPAGRFAANTGTTTSNCEGLCQPGYYCTAGSATERQNQCAAGHYGNTYGNTASTCDGKCAAGYYCVPGSVTATPQLCRAGYYGVSGGNYLDSTCAGKCSAGYYCSAGSGSATQNACPSGDKSVYCPAGSAEPVAVSPGYKAASGQTKQEPCPAGSYCSGGVQKDCPVGRYGSASGLFTAECSGECQAGFFCPAGSTSPRQEKCADSSSAPSVCRTTTPKLCYCESGATSVGILSSAERSTHYTIPESSQPNRREDKAACPSTNKCENGEMLASIEWTNCADGATGRSVDENTASADIGTPLSTSKTSTFSIASLTRPSGCTDGTFSITSAGQLKLSSTIDYEDCPYFIAKVAATDSLDTIYCDVTINVNDLNDAPTISNCGNRDVDETAGELANIGNEFVVSDPDKGQTGTWTISSITPDQGNIKINPCTGQLQVREATLNYESQQSYSATLVVTDDGKPSKSATCNMVIYVNDANDPPTMDDASVSVSEATSAGTSILTLTGDDPEGKALKFRLSKDDPSGIKAFTIDANGVVRVATSPTGGTYLDYEDRVRWTLQAEVEDDGGLKAVAEVVITVTDANDAPTMTGPIALFVTEDKTSGNFGDVLTGRDQDAGESSSLTFFIDGSASGLPFSLATSGQFSVSGSLDYETTAKYTFKVYAKDARGATSNTVTVNVDIGDVNEAPSFDNAPFAFSLAESASIGDDVGLPVRASDPDNRQTLVYSILSPSSGLDGSSFFSIGALDGQVQLKKKVDFEAMSSPYKYFFRVQVKDNHGSPIAVVTDASVTITNVNEPPVIATQTRSVDENSAAGTNVGAAIVASDPDAATFEAGATPTFAITGGNDGGAFSITAGGQIKVAKSSAINYEQSSSRVLTVRATDTAGNEGFGTVTVNILDVNEAPEFFILAATLEGVVPELSPVGTKVGDPVSANDPDDSQTLSFSIDSGTGSEYFTISATTGQVTVAKTLPDASNSFTLTLRVTDNGSPVKSSTAPMEITLTDTNRRPTIDDASRSIREDAYLNQAVGAKLVATDPDDGETETLEFSLALEGNPGGAFSIGTSDGQLRVANPGALDYETQSVYSLKVTVTDKPVSSDPSTPAPPSLSDTAVITVTILNANEAPQLANVELRVPENSAVGTDVGARLVGTDVDAGDAAKLTYSISSTPTRDDGGVFRITSNGQVQVNLAKLDFEKRQLYTFGVRVSDNDATDPKSSVGIVTIKVDDVNEAPQLPVLEDVEVLESTAARSFIGAAVRATDQDGDSLTYTLDPASSVFSINAITGQLQLSVAVDHETKSSYALTVKVSDGEFSHTAPLTVVILDVNEAPTVSAPSGVTVNENTAADIKVASVTVVDQDDGDSIRSYSIVSGNEGDAFKIDANGNVLTKTKSALNWEVLPSFTLGIVATDRQGLTGSTELTITVVDVPEAPVLADVAASVPENSAADVTVAALKVTDQDVGETHSFSIVGGSDHFKIVGALLKTSSTATNFEVRTEYRLTLRVTDKDGLTDSAEAIIKVLDVNEPPTLVGGSRSIEENSPTLAIVGDPIMGSDPDQFQVLSYTLVGHSEGIFKIDTCSGQIQVAKAVLDYETKSTYTLTVRAKDDGTPENLFATATFTINVLDVNEPPVMRDYADFTIMENSAENVDVASALEASDQDGNGLTYAIAAGNEGGAFKIRTVGNKGQISVARAILDFETPPQVYELTIKITDDGVGMLSSTAKVTITLLDANEAPVFPATTVNVNENSNAGTLVGAPLKCSDVDAPKTAAPLKYSIVTGGTPFTIQAETGQLTVSDPTALDHETKSVWVFTAKCVDDHPTDAKEATATISVLINDVNERPTLADGTRSVAENSAAGVAVGDPIKGSDVDLGQTLTYRILSQSVAGVFRIDALTGQLEVSSPQLNYEVEPRSYDVQVEARDNGAGYLTATATYNVYTTDARENPEMPVGEVREVDENSPENTAIGGALRAFDPDEGNTLTYHIASGDDGGLFRISADGQLYVQKSVLNYEATREYKIFVTAKDNTGLTDTEAVTVRVRDVNEAPTFTSSSFDFSVAEDAALGVVIGSAVASDVDGGETLTYTLDSSDAGTRFTVVAASGAIKVNAPGTLALTTYTLTVRVTDSRNSYATATVKVQVVDKNDAPVINDATRSVNENAVVNTAVGSPVTGTDVDTDQTLTYAIVDGNHNDAFKVNPVSGQISVNKAVLDFESRAVYELKLRVSDNGAGLLSDTCTVTVSLNDVQEKPKMNTGVFEVLEMSVVGTVVTSTSASGVDAVTASDPDAADSGKLKFAIKSGNVGDAFLVNQATGQLTVKSNVINYELRSSYTLEISVTDTAGNSDTANVVVTVLDDNDAPVLHDAVRSVLENEPAGALVGEVLVARDEDAAQSITFTIVSGNTYGTFDITPSGQVVVFNPSTLNHELKDSYTLTVKAEDDGGGRPKKHDTATVTITVEDRNEAPVFGKAEYGLNIAENSPAGTPVSGGLVTATDVDDGQLLAYSIAGGNDVFQINGVSGQITVKTGAKLDHETKDSYSLEVVCKDNGSPVLTTSVPVVITIDDVNEAPIIEDAVRSVDENSIVGTLIGTRLPATDVDAGQTLTYAIVSPPAFSLFSIVGHTGQLLVNEAKLDHETKDSYTITVRVTDLATGGLSDEAQVIVLINDVNEPPVIEDQVREVNENSVDGTPIGDPLPASDVDEGQLLIFTIESGNVGGRFKIDPCNGQLMVSKELFNFEDRATYTLTVRVADNGDPQLSDTAEVTVNLLDVNEAPVLPAVSLSCDENLATGTTFGAPMVGSDVDAGQTLSYAIVSGNDDNTFAIDSATGQFRVAEPRLDFERRSTYAVTVRVTDNGTPALSTASVASISVNDVNEAPVYPNADRELPENSAANTPVGLPVTATDVDARTTLTYRLITPGTPFAINPNTGQLSVENPILDYESGVNVYTITAGASDGKLETVNTIIVRLVDVNEAPDMPAQSRAVDENTAALTTVGAPVQGTDVDAGQKLSYFIVGGNTGDAFFIDRDSGQIQVRASNVLDHETQDEYKLQVQVVDNGAGALRDVGIVTVSVNDVNDAPKFPASTRRTINENSASGVPAGAAVLGTDEDAGDSITYSITGGSGRDLFTVDANSGVISAADGADLNFEATPSLDVQITATDSAGATAVGTVTIDLIDLNEAPVMEDQERSVREKVPVDTVVGALLKVSDVDAGDSHEFTIIGGNELGHFRLRGTTGELLVAGPLDNQAKAVYALTVRVVDKGFMADTAVITINVFDQNDPPVMTDRRFEIAENSPVAANVGTPVTGVDPEGQTLTYSIVAGNVDNTFAIDQNTAQLRVARALLDFETRTTYSLTVQARDDGMGQMTGSCIVTVALLDVNERPIIASNTVRNVHENVPTNTLVGLPVAGSDVDAGAAGQLSYEIVSGNEKQYFRLDPSTAQISVFAAKLDYEVESSYDLLIRVKDHGFPQLSAEATVTVRIMDVNDRPSLADVTISTPENRKKSDKIGAALVGFDQDRSSYLTYTLTGANCWGSSSGTIRYAYQFIDQTLPAAIEGTFRVRASDNALFSLWEDPADPDAMYEIQLSNTVSTIAKGSRSPPLADADSAGILDASTHRQFWFRLAGGTVSVGTGRTIGTNLVVSYNDASPLNARTIGVSTAGSEADFTSICFDLGGQPTAADMFEVQVGSGQISMRKAGLNYESVRFYSFEVTTTDDGAGSLSDTAIVRVNVQDVNEAPAFVDDCPTSIAGVVGCFSVNENSAVGTTVASTNPSAAYPTGVYGTDPDTLDGQTVTYSLLPTGNVGGAFTIDANTGVLSVAASVLDHEGSTPSYTLTVAVTDSFEDAPIQTRAQVVITVEDVNEAPVIVDTTRHVRESTDSPPSIDDMSSVVGTAVGAPIPSSDVDDPSLDIGKRTYSIVAGDDAGVFTIHATTGQIQLAQAVPNYEDEDLDGWELTVRVTDLGGLTDDAVVTVVVDDVNEPPSIEPATRSIPENSEEGTLIGLPLPSSDPDIGQTLTYAITDGEGRGVFKISPCSGQLEVLKPLDYEAKNSYTMEVTVTDDGVDPARLQASATITVNIVDVNEKPTIDDTVRNVDENVAVGTPVGGYIPASDPDTRRPDKLTYTIVGGNDLGYFQIDGETGQISVAIASLDYETRTKYNLLVKVTDDGEGKLFDTATVTVNINDVNEAPVMPDADRSVKENVAVGTPVGLPLVATDVEVAAGRQSLTFSILAGNEDGRFTINPASGQLSVELAELDYEDVSKYVLSVQVKDDGPNTLKDTAKITISIINVNEPPTVEDAVRTLAEDEVLGQHVGAPIPASDPEGLDLVFAITGGDDASVFAIDNNGQISVRNPMIDFETQPEYTLLVKVTDAGDGLTNRLTDTATVVIQVQNVNEPPTMGSFALSIDENSAVDTPVGAKVFGGDLDVSTGDAESLQYSLTNPTGTDFFKIDATTGQISVKTAGLNFEDQKSFVVQVTATDTGGLTATAPTVITVVDLNEAPTVTVPGIFAAHEQANVGDKACFGSTCAVSGNDVDAGDALTYSITSSVACADKDTTTGCTSAPGIFKIDAVSGTISVADNTATAFRSPTAVRLQVRVTDRAGLFGTAEVVVEMSNVNLPPTLAPHSVNIAENTAPTTDIPGQIIAVDTDVSDTGEHDKLTYAILSVTPESGTKFFALKALPTAGTGGGTQLQVVAAGLDHEANAIYTVKVGVTDDGEPPRGTSNDVTVVITDVNEPPVVAAQSRPVNENSPVGTPLGAPLVASDPDDGDVLTYSLALRGADATAGIANPFAIDSATGQVTVASDVLDFETKTGYSLTLSASDGNEVRTADLDVTVVNVNERPAIAPQTFSIVENSPRDAAVGNVVATDEDAKSITTHLSYFLSVSDPTTNNADELFQINRDTGAITVKRADLDYERKTTYTMTIRVVDDWPANPLEQTATITVNLIDVNDLTVTGFSLGSPTADPDVQFSTVGGTWVTLIGTNMGRTVAPANPEDGPTVTATYQTIVDGVLYGEVYTSPECLITTANTKVACKTAPGVGSNLQWTLTVGEWTAKSKKASGAPLTTSYMAPVITAVEGADALKTAGGESFTIRGQNFGPVGTSPVRLDYTPLGYASTVQLLGVDCAVVSHEEATCKSAVGVGHNLKFTITLPDTQARLSSAPKSTTASYASPSIASIKALSGDGTEQLETAGGDKLELTGTNFGPEWSKHVSATYGPAGIGFTATGCRVTKAHTTMECTTAPGIGAVQRWVATVAGVSSSTSLTFTSYKRPVIESLSGPGYINADTKGGQPVFITGSQFGPILSAANAVGVGYYGAPVAVYGGDIINGGSRFMATDCAVTAAHTQIRCITAPGTGRGHSWRVSLGAQNSDVADVDQSYAPPVIVAFSDVGAANAQTPGGQSVIIEGRQFGFDDAMIDSVTYGVDSAEFDVTADCVVLEAHRRIQCDTTEGAGAGLKWLVVIDGQESGAPTTYYEPPSITGISGPGAAGASTNGGQQVIISGKNFGPSSKPEFLQAVSFGATGTQYSVTKSCTVIDHDEIRCITEPGVGAALSWFVTVKGQTSAAIDEALYTSFAPPSITSMSATSGSTAGNYEIVVTGTNFGFTTALARRTSSFALRWNGVDLDDLDIRQKKYINPDTGAQVTPDPVTKLVPTNTLHRFSFVVPEATEFGADRTVQVVVTDQEGTEVVSDPVTFTYQDPTIIGVYPVNNRDSGLKELQVEGSNFGVDGIVTVTDSDGVEQVVSCEFDDGRGFQWTHTFITCKYDGLQGSVVVTRGEQTSNSWEFEHRAPQIAALASASTPADLKYFLTQGGEDMTIQGYDIAKDKKDLNITIGGEHCPIVGEITSVVTDTDEVVTVRCSVPPGQGLLQPVKVISYGQPSAGRPINYDYPFISDVQPRTVPTAGGAHIQIYGWNFGVHSQTAFLVKNDGSTELAMSCTWGHRHADCVVPEGSGTDYFVRVQIDQGAGFLMLDDPLGRYRLKQKYEDYNAALPAGAVPVVFSVNTCPEVSTNVPAGQRVCDGREGGDRVPFKFQAPVVTSVDMPANPHTRGGYTFTIRGSNFGHEHANVKVELRDTRFTSRRLAPASGAASTELEVVSHDHSSITVVMPPAAGGSGLIPVATVDGQESPMVGASVPTFTFSTPRVFDVQPPTASTSGLTPAGDRVILNITGENFGMGGKVYLHSDPAENPAVLVELVDLQWTHSWISAELPAGQGINRRVEVAVAGQSTTDPVTFSYEMPQIVALHPDTSTFVRKSDRFPTSGDYKVTIEGSSLGYIDGGVTVDGRAAVITRQDHTEMDFTMPSGIGKDLDLIVTVGVSGVSQPFKLSYDPPRIDYINPFPANAQGQIVKIHGANFGSPGTSSRLQLIVNNENCTDAVVVKAPEGGNDFISCELPRQPVGYKNITLSVAKQVVSYINTLVLKTNCKAGFYGQRGEVCLPCPRGATCAGGDHPTFYEMEAEPVSNDGWWLKNVSDEVSLCPPERLETRLFLEGQFKPHCPHALPCEPRQACNGSNTCNLGYTGERCALCAQKYYRRAGECVECPNNPLILIGAFLITAICLMIGGYFLNKKSVNLAFISIGVDYFQVLALFANSRVTWPPFVKDMFHLMSVFNFNLEITAPECSIPDLGYKTKWLFVMALPLAATLMFLVAHVAQLCKKRCIQGRRKDLHHHVNLLVATFMVMFYYMYLYLTRTTLDVFNCAPTDPPDGHEYLEVVFERCDEPGGIHETLLPLAVATFFAYTIGYPLVLGIILFKNRDLVMEDQLLRAMEVGNTRLTNPNAYDLRKRYHKMYYHFKPDFWYWIMVIIMRKFLIAFTALMFNKNPAFQLSMALLVMFAAYALQVRNTPYMSMSEHADVVTHHKHKVDDGDPKHLKLAGAVADVASRGKRRTKHFSWNNPSAGSAASAAANFFWNYNTVEAVLLACAVLVTLAGIMFESGRFDSEYYATQRDFITVCVMFVVFFSLAYFFTVLLSEMWTTFCKKPQRKKARKGRRDSSAKDLMTMASSPTNGEEGERGRSNTEINPMFLLNRAGETKAHTETIMASHDAPDAANWKVIRNQYNILQAELASAKKKIQQYEDLRQGKGGLAGVVESASARSRVKVQFSAQQTADASARKAAGRMLRRVRSGKRGKLSQLRGAGSRGGSPRSAGGSSPKPPTSPAPAPVQGAASGAGAAPSISADEWSKKTPEEQAAARKAYEDWMAKYGPQAQQ